jgi:beta-glucosidase/6-phospho-beta-glucosidase/beta-galactosidase
MARKTKQIQKEEKNDAPAPAATKKAGKKANEANWDIFSEGFKDRLSQFVDLNEEVL